MFDPRYQRNAQVRENPQLLAIVGAAGMGALGNPGIQAGMIVQRVDEDGVPMRRLFRVVRVIPGSPAGPGRLWAMPDVAQLVYEDGPRRGHDAGQEALAGLVVANPRGGKKSGAFEVIYNYSGDLNHGVRVLGLFPSRAHAEGAAQEVARRDQGVFLWIRKTSDASVRGYKPFRGPGTLSNPDEELRRLERAAATGDPESARRLKAALKRAGVLPDHQGPAHMERMRQAAAERSEYMRARRAALRGAVDEEDEDRRREEFCRLHGSSWRKNPCPLTKAQQRAACKVMGNPARYSRAARAFMEHKVPLLIAEGYPPKQAVAIAFNMARQQGLKVPGQKTARMKKKNAPTASKGGKLGPRPRVSGSADLSQIEGAFAPADVKRAQKRYRMFHGVDADQATVFRVDDGKPGVTRHLVVGLGETPQTSYQVPWDGSTKEDHVWVHDHPDDNRPLKVIDPKTNVVSDLPTHPRARVDDFFRD